MTPSQKRCGLLPRLGSQTHRWCQHQAGPTCRALAGATSGHTWVRCASNESLATLVHLRARWAASPWALPAKRHGTHEWPVCAAVGGYREQWLCMWHRSLASTMDGWMDGTMLSSTCLCHTPWMDGTMLSGTCLCHTPWMDGTKLASTCPCHAPFPVHHQFGWHEAGMSFSCTCSRTSSALLAHKTCLPVHSACAPACSSM